MDLSRLQKAAAIAASRNAMSDWESLPVADGAVYQPVVDLSPPAAAQEQQEESGAVTRNFKKSFAQVPQAIGGTIAAVGDVIGADGMRDYGLELYKSASKNVESLTRDSDSFSSMIEGKTGFGDWIAGASGYVVGQALQMIATGGAGAALGKLGAQKAAQWAAKELGETAAKRAAVAGAAGAVGLANAGQEVGSVYPEMLDEVRKQGREPDAADKARAIMFALGAAGLDTAVDMTLAGRALRGAAGGGIRGLAGEVVKSAGKETGTEAVQTVMERAGAQQSLGDADAVRDVIDSAAIGAVGGGGAGAIAGLHGGRGTQTLPPVNQGAPDAGAPPPDAGPAQPGPDGQQPPALPPPGVPNPDTQAPAGPSGPGPAQPPGGPDAGATPDAGPAQPDAPAQAMAAPAPDAGPAPVAPASAPGEPGAQEVAQGGPVGPASSMGGGPVGPTPAQGGGPVGPAGPGGGPVTPMAPPAGPLTAALQSAPQAVAHAQGLQRAQAAALEQQRIAAQPAPAPQDPFAADVQALHALLQDQDALDRVAAVSGEQGVQAILKSAADAANPRLPAPARLRAINIVRRRLAGQEPINAPTRTSSPLQRPAEPGVGGVATGPDLGAGVQVPAGMGPAPAEPLAPGLHRADGPGAVDPAGLAARGPQPAADAVAPAVYPSIGEATDYIRAARRRGSNVAAKVVPVRGGFQIITPADPGFAEAMDARQNGPVIESTAREIPSGQAGRTQPAPGRADVAPAPSADPATPLRDSIQRPADPIAEVGPEHAEQLRDELAAEQRMSADRPAAQDVPELREPEADAHTSSPARETLGDPGSPYETDLFGNALPDQPRKTGAGSRRQAAGDQDVLPVAAIPHAPEGEYATRAALVTTRQQQLGHDGPVESLVGAANALAYLHRSAVERLDALVTDARGKPLAIIGGFKGEIASTPVFPSTLIGEAVQVGRAANLWLVHNHPSGEARLSKADRTLMHGLARMFEGTAIDVRGIIAVTRNQWSGETPDGAKDWSDLKPVAGPTVPAQERQIARDGRLSDEKISSPADARREVGAIVSMNAGRPTIVLLNSQHQPIAAVPWAAVDAMPLKGNGKLDALLRAVAQANAARAIIGTGSEMSLAQAQNLAAGLGRMNVSVIDIIDGDGQSAAEQGRPLRADVLESRSETPAGWGSVSNEPESAPVDPKLAEDRKAQVRRELADAGLGAEVEALERSGKLVIEHNPASSSRGSFDGRTATLNAARLEDGQALGVLLHEVGAHMGLRRLIGDELYDMLPGRIRALAAQGMREAVAAVRAAEQDTAARQASGRRSTTAIENEEVIAYFVQAMTESRQMRGRGLIHQIVTAVRAALRRLGFNLQVSPRDVAGMAMAAVKAEARSANAASKGGVAEEGAGVRASATKERVTPGLVQTERPDETGSEARASSARPNEVTRESKTGTTSGTSVADSTLESRSPRHSGDVLEARLGSLLTQGAGAITDRLTRWMTDGMENRPAWEGKILPRAGQRVLNGLKTQYHKAQREPLYRPVFEAMRAFSTDTARIANQAASLAPDLLVDLDQFKDALPALLGGRKGASKADLAKVSKAIFDGTLVKPDDVMAGKTWTDAELASQFGMNAYQIELYRQARAAIDQSLDDFGRAQLGVLTRGEVAKAVTAQAQAAPKMADAARVLAADLRQQAAGFAQQGKTAEAQKATDLADKVGAMAAHVAKLKDAGYAPLYRFGTFAVSAFDPSGKTLYYATFDNLREANAHRRAIEPTIQAQHPNAVIRSGHVNPEEGKLFRQVSLSTLEVFGDVAFSGDPAWKTYIELTKNSRSSLKRLLERQGTAGFSTDIQRGLSSFITSNARYASGALHLHDATQAAAAIPTERGDVKREAQRLIEYVQDPREEMAGFRGLMFTWYLGGSVAAAAVNMTQSLTMTYPWLAQHESIAQASARVLAAMSAVARGVYGDPTMAAAVRRADANGITSPQQIYYLQAEQSRTFGNSMAVRKFMHAWGYMFGKAEQYNRRVAFVAAYRQAQQRGIADPYAYAAKAVDETQGVYCVDTETEMLTADGWKRYNQIRVGERAFGVDADGNLVETEINGVHVFHGKHVAEHIHGPEGTSIVVTAEHRNFIQCYNSRDKKHQRPRMVLTKDLKGCHLIPRAPLGDATERVAVYTDDQVRLIAWVAAEGHFFAHRNCKVKRAVGIVQSLTHNPHYVEEIDALLNRLGGHFNRKVSKKRARGDVMVTWQLRKPLWEFIGRALPQKRVSMDLLSKLTVPQMRVFIEEFAKGDGTGNGSETAGLGIGQKSIETLDTLQAMAALTGSASTCWHRQKNTLTGGVRDHGTVYIHRGNKRAQVGAMKRESIVVDTVWCPETGSGTWIARRNGRTFVTGNSRESRPNYGRGSIGAAALTFKQYSIGYLEFLARMIRHDPNRSAEENAQAKRAAALAMGVLFLFAGTSGLPFMTDAEDLIDTIMQALGFNWRTAARRKQFVASVFGDAFAGFAERGISPALPMDIQSRLGMGNLIPGTDALRQDKDPRAREKSEVFGVAGGLAEKAQDAAEEAVRGNLSRAAAMAAPKAITDLLVGLDMAMTGRYRDTRGRNVIDVGLGDAITKGIGFQPEDVSAVQRAAREANATAAMHRGVKDEITQRWAAGIAANDPDEIEAARAQLRAYNQSNPDMRITVAPASLRSRVRQINLTKAERVRRALPKDIRAVVAQSS